MELERRELLWRIKRRKSAHTSPASAMYPEESNTAQTRVAMLEVTTSKSRVNAITRHVR